MSEAVARAVGGGVASPPIMIAGKPCSPRPLSVKELAEVERECVRRYKQEYLASYRAGLELTEGIDRHVAYMDKLAEVAKWDIADLPARYAAHAAKITVTPALREWAAGLFTLPAAIADKSIGRLAAGALDNKILSAAEYTALTGDAPPMVRVDYVNWWITGPLEGKITFIWVAVRGAGVTWDEVAAEVGNNPALADLLSRDIEELSAPRPDFG